MSSQQTDQALPVVDAFAIIGPQPDDDRDLSAQALLLQMRGEGISSALVASFSAIRYDQACGNRELAALCRQQRGFYPLAVLNPAPFYDLAEHISTCTRPPFVGVRFTPYRQGWSLHSAPFQQALKLAGSADLPVSVEVGVSGDASWLGELSVRCGAPLVLAMLTYALMGEALAVMEAHPHICLELTRPVSPGIIETLVERLGHDRILFASGAPAWSAAPGLEIVRQAEISPAAKSAILGGNARRIYRLPSREAA